MSVLPILSAAHSVVGMPYGLATTYQENAGTAVVVAENRLSVFHHVLQPL